MARKEPSDLTAQDRHLTVRRGKQKAAVAVGQTVLGIAYERKSSGGGRCPSGRKNGLAHWVDICYPTPPVD